MLKEIQDENFKKEVLETSMEKPVLVDFQAPWCTPCKVLEPVIKELALEMRDLALIAKLNTQTSIKTAIDYNIMSVPTIAIFRGGREKERVVGLRSKEALIQIINKYK